MPRVSARNSRPLNPTICKGIGKLFADFVKESNEKKHDGMREAAEKVAKKLEGLLEYKTPEEMAAD